METKKKKVSRSFTLDNEVLDELFITSLRIFLISQSEFLNYLLIYLFSNKSAGKNFYKFLKKELKK